MSEHKVIRADSRGRISLAKIVKEPSDLYRVSVSASGAVKMEPVVMLTDAELAKIVDEAHDNG